MKQPDLFYEYVNGGKISARPEAAPKSDYNKSVIASCFHKAGNNLKTPMLAPASDYCCGQLTLGIVNMSENHILRRVFHNGNYDTLFLGILTRRIMIQI